MRYGFVVLGMLLCLVTSATAGVSIGIGIGLPTVSIGINLPLYPELVPVPGYPVYYAPGIDGNYFFYDGMYWVYQDDNWYASSWYNGPWGFVDPTVVPLFVLRVPVSYYRQPPIYFSGWRSDAPPRWGQRWGHSWEQRRGGWDRWDRRSAPRAAPLPVYQRQYAGDRYPRAEQQRSLRSQQYRYQPRDKVVRQHLKQVDHTPAPALRQRQEKPQVRTPQRQENQHSQPQRQSAPTAQRPQPQRGGENERRAAPVQAPAQQRGPAHEQRQQPAAAPREQRAPQHELKQQPAAAPREQRAPQEREQQRGQEQRQENGGSHDRGGPQDRGHGNKDEGRGR
ncbi:MAG: hypothetical protein A2075_04685 [Geobacteraceae bacterium GWC2_58_44]|nr:MAG: hypothetical protein A2075_04685 [Geobacteraceae bacterium GWC2_58_44]